MRLKHSFIKLSFTIFSLCLCFTSFGQSRGNNIRSEVLLKNIAGKKYVFDYSKKKDHDETQLTYLGILKAIDGRQYKVMSYCWIWGISKRATNRILIYSAQNKYLGDYYLTTIDELPTKIESNQLIFKVKDDSSSKVTITRISFKKGIPKSIYLKEDNIYPFETN